MSNFDCLQGHPTDRDTLYVPRATSEALLAAADFTRSQDGRMIAPTGEQYWVRSEAAQHAIRIILGR